MPLFTGSYIYKKGTVSKEEYILYDAERLCKFNKITFLKLMKMSPECVNLKGISRVERVAVKGVEQMHTSSS